MGVVRGLLKPFEIWNDWALALGRWLALFALVVMVVVTLAQVFFRYVLNNALPWPDEAARFCMLWMVGLAAPTAFRRGGFVAIDTIEQFLSHNVARVLTLVLLMLSMMVLVVGIQLGWNHVNSGWLFNSSSLRVPLEWLGGENIRIKLAWMYMSVFVAMVLLTIVNIELILRQVVKLAGQGETLKFLDPGDLPEAE